MSLLPVIRRPKPKHRAVDKVANLRDENQRLLRQLIGAHDYIALADDTLADVRAKRAEAEQEVVSLSATVDDLTAERNELTATNESLRKQLAPYLAADANRDAITVPQAERDTSDGADQATSPIDVRPLWQAHGIGPVIRIADKPATDDPRTPTWVPGPDSETTQSLRIA